MKNDVYGEPVIVTEGYITARVYSPILTEEERNRRLEAVKRAAISLLLSMEEQEEK